MQVWKRNLARVMDSEAAGRRTRVAYTRAVHLDKTFTRIQLVGLLDWVVFVDFDRSPWLGDNGGDLNLRNRHCRKQGGRE